MERPPIGGSKVDILYSEADDDSPITPQHLESDSVLEERVAEMRDQFSKCAVPVSLEEPMSPPLSVISAPQMPSVSCLMDPRLARDHHHHHFLGGNSGDLIGTVEKTLSIFGFEDRKPEPITPAKRKVWIFRLFL